MEGLGACPVRECCILAAVQAHAVDSAAQRGAAAAGGAATGIMLLLSLSLSLSHDPAVRDTVTGLK